MSCIMYVMYHVLYIMYYRSCIMHHILCIMNDVLCIMYYVLHIIYYLLYDMISYDMIAAAVAEAETGSTNGKPKLVHDF